MCLNNKNVKCLFFLLLAVASGQPGPEVIKLFSMLNSAEQEIYPAHKC